MNAAPPERLSYTQFAARHGLVTEYEVQGHLHGGLRAAHMPKSFHRNFQKRLLELQDLRDEGRQKYKDAIERGEILPPVELTSRERLEITASGDPNKESTQAARRVLARIAERAVAATRPHDSAGCMPPEVFSDPAPSSVEER